MKKALLISWILIASLVYFSACSSDSGSDDDSDDSSDASVPKVTQFAPSDVHKSGATDLIADEESVVACVSYLFGDTAVADLLSSFAGAVPEYAIKGSEIKRATTGSLSTFLANIKAALEDFPVDKAMDETYSQSNVAIGNYYTAKTIGATIKADLVTTDSKEADFEELANVKSATGKVTMNADIEQSDGDVESLIVDSKFRINLAAEGSCGTVATADGRDPSNLVFTAALSASLAVSVNAGGTGGILIINADSALPTATVADPTADDAFDSLTPTLAVTITVYDDAGTATFTKKFSDFKSFKAWVDAM